MEVGMSNPHDCIEMKRVNDSMAAHQKGSFRSVCVVDMETVYLKATTDNGSSAIFPIRSCPFCGEQLEKRPPLADEPAKVIHYAPKIAF